MFREFNVKFEDVEMIGGTDNLLENTEITKVIVRGDSKMSSLDSTFKNCKELDTIDGELDLNDVSDIDNLLENTELVRSISLKNINNENISANNSFPHIEEINIGGELYNKKAMQNVIASKEWTFDNITYSGTVGDNVVTKETNINDNNKVTIQDTLEQKARGFEIIGQTYENLVVGNGEVTLLDELTLESIDGSSNEFNPHIEQPVCVETIEGETYQNLVNGKGEYKLTDTFSKTWTESDCSIDNPPSMIKIPEIWGNTVQGYANVVSAQQIVNSINNSMPNESRLHSNDSTTFVVNHSTPSATPTSSDNFIQLKANTVYSIRCYRFNSTQNPLIYYYLGNNYSVIRSANGGSTFTTDSSGKVLFYPASAQGGQLYLRVVEGSVNLNSYNYNEFDLNYIQSVGDLYVDENGEAILDEDGNEQYKLEVESISPSNLFNINGKINSVLEGSYIAWGGEPKVEGNNITTYNYAEADGYGQFINVKPNTKYTLSYAREDDYIYTIKVFGNHKNNHIATAMSHRNGKITFDTSDNSIIFIMFLSMSVTEGRTIRNLKLEEGSTSTEYTPYQSNKTTILLPQQLKGLSDVKDRLFYDYTKNVYVIENKIGDFNNINDLSEAILSVPKMIETKALEKLSLETYLPKTYISTNTEVQPSQMTINNKKTLINLKELSNNTNYTIQFKCSEKSDNPIKFNLCGTEKEVNMPVGVNHVSITTSNSLTSNQLELSGTGNTVSEVMVVEGEMNQYPEYFDGVVNTGVLQNSKYKISIKTNERFNVFIHSNNPLAKGDKLYWNKTNNRYEIDRNGNIEVPTVTGDIIDLPRLYQRENTNLMVETGNIKPSNIKVEYLDID